METNVRIRFFAGTIGATILICLTSCGDSWDSVHRKETERLGAQIITALDKYRAANGAYPIHLADLVPKEIADLPKATVGNRTWLYRRTAGDNYVLEIRGSSAHDPMMWYSSQSKTWSFDDK